MGDAWDWWAGWLYRLAFVLAVLELLVVLFAASPLREGLYCTVGGGSREFVEVCGELNGSFVPYCLPSSGLEVSSGWNTLGGWRDD